MIRLSTIRTSLALSHFSLGRRHDDESEIVISASTKQRNMLSTFRNSVISAKFLALDVERPLSFWNVLDSHVATDEGCWRAVWFQAQANQNALCVVKPSSPRAAVLLNRRFGGHLTTENSQVLWLQVASSPINTHNPQHQLNHASSRVIPWSIQNRFVPSQFVCCVCSCLSGLSVCVPTLSLPIPSFASLDGACLFVPCVPDLV